jgi:hypothetical protein
MAWYEEVGLRREGVLCGLTKDKIATYDQIEQKRREDDTFRISVCEKGRKTRFVCVTARLMEMTADYVRYERAAVVKRYRNRPGWTEPQEVFLSDRGTRLNLKSVSNIMTQIFRDAHVLNASGQRLRARYLTRLVESFLERKDEAGTTIDHDTVLLKAAEAAGHIHPETLRPYLNLVLKKRILRSEAELARQKAQNEREAARHAELTARRLVTANGVKALLEAVKNGDSGRAADAITLLQKQFGIRGRHVQSS